MLIHDCMDWNVLLCFCSSYSSSIFFAFSTKKTKKSNIKTLYQPQILFIRIPTMSLSLSSTLHIIIAK